MEPPPALAALRIRTITTFLDLPANELSWPSIVKDAGRFLKAAQTAFEGAGYEVQTVRIATTPFEAWNPHPAQLIPRIKFLESLCNAQGVRLISVGPTTNEALLPRLPGLIAATSAVSCSYALPESFDFGQCVAAAECVLEIAARTNGAGNFRFCTAAHCDPGIPYFPIAHAPTGAKCFAVGTENDALLHAAFTAAAAEAAQLAEEAKAAAATAGIGAAEDVDLLPLLAGSSSDGNDESNSGGDPGDGDGGRAAAAAGDRQQSLLAAGGGNAGAHRFVLRAAEARFLQALAAALAPVEAICERLGGDSGFTYLGIDTSLAPGLDTPSMTDSYEALGLGTFGGPSTLAISSIITRALKSVPVKRTGYCGLMLPVCEDAGLAAAAAAGALRISQLLHYSAVCGCGLDTVPVPGPVLRLAGGGALALLAGGNGVDGPLSISAGGAAAAADPGPSSQSMGNAATAATIETAIAGNGAAAAASSAHGSTKAVPPMSADELRLAVAGVIADTAALAHRLRKPLTCRLLPIPGLGAGQATSFTNPYLIDSRVMGFE